MTDSVPIREKSSARPRPEAVSRALGFIAIGVLVAIGWAYLVLAAASGGGIASLGPGMAALAPLLEPLAGILPGAHAGHGSLAPAAWSGGDILAVLAMWAAMVLAMMLPTAVPTLRAYSGGAGRVGAVASGYVAVWLAVSAVGAGAQALLVGAAALSPDMAPAGVALSASILIAAGLYQFTPLKLACLARCRSPHKVAARVRTTAGAVRAGVDEGIACLGCCWAMMAVMFAAGLMNLAAMAFLGAMMALEKRAAGLTFTRGLGVVLLVAGVGLAIGRFFG